MSKIQYNSPVILSFTIMSFAALVLNYVTDGASNQLLFSVYRTGFNDLLGYLRLFTHIMGHIDIEHFVSNFTFILLLGPMIEEKYSSSRLVAMILFTALVTGIINNLFFPYTMLMGASGIVFMLIILSSFTNLKSGKIPLTFIFIVVIYIGGEVFNAFSSQDNISQLAHIIGGICGSIFGFGFAAYKDKGKAE